MRVRNIGRQHVVIGVMGTWLLGSFVFVLATTNLPILRMAFGVVLLWIVMGGGLMYYYKDSIKIFAERFSVRWPLLFVMSATILALIEEAITTAMTNMAPLFGSRVGEVYITASTNYLDVILFHSVIMFVPFFVGLAYALSRYDLSPSGVFWLFGVLGLLLEVLYGGISALGNAIFWIFVYGLMVYIPAYIIPKDRDTKPMRIWHYPAAFCIMVLIALPQVFILYFVITNILQHPPIHF